MKFIDSNVLAYAFYENRFQENCQQVIQEEGIINTINIVEAFNIIEFETSREHAAKAIRSLLKSGLAIVPVDSRLIFESLKRSEKVSKLRFIDLVHYTTAGMNNCQAIVSLDADFNGLNIPRVDP